MINAPVDRSSYPSLDDCTYLNQASLGLIGQQAVQSMHAFLDNAARHTRGSGIREVKRFQRIHGEGRWRKRKGYATIQMVDGPLLEAEIHKYEATGPGNREFKLNRIVK